MFPRSFSLIDRRGTRLAVLSLGTCLVSAGAHAAPDEPMARRADPRPIPEHLQVGDLAAPSPEPLAGAAKSNTFFLNYDGVTIKFTGAEDDSSQNVSQFPDFAMTYAPYGDGPKRAASMQALKSDWSKYAVVVTDQRPNGNYTMCVNSPTNPFGGGVLGIAPLDCNDGQARNIVFAYHDANDQFSAATQSTTMSQEIAHAFGLEHVQQENDIMNPYNAGGDPSFIDQCFALDGGGMGIICGQQHQQFCQNGQNSHQELVWLFGLSEPDTEPPSCVISGPSEGQTFDAGANFTVFANATDNQGVVEVKLYMNDVYQASDNSSPYSWDLTNVPANTYCFKCEALDDANNVGTSTPVCVTVTEPGDPGTTSTTTTSGGPTTLPETDVGGDSASSEPTGGTGGGGGSDTDVSPDSSALPPGFGQNGGDEGCGCTEHRRPGAAGLLLLVALAGLRRRRARA